MKTIAILLLITVLSGCNSAHERSNTSTPLYPDLLLNALNAHGGLEKWSSFKSMEFDLYQQGESVIENHLIDLNNRKVLIQSDSFSIGMDGKEVWASPDIEATGMQSPRFYHNLFFYFLSMPFVLADPGVQYEDMGITTLDGKQYKALKITFNPGTGDAGNDIYIAHFNPSTYKLEILLYTVSYYSGEKSENFNVLRYLNYQTINGIELAMNLQGFKFKNGKIGEARYGVNFKNILLKSSEPNFELFEMPESAEIDSLKKN